MSPAPTVAPGMQNPSSKVWRKVMIRQLLVAFTAIALSACGAGVETDALETAAQALSIDASLSASTQDPVPPPQRLTGELLLAFDAQGMPFFVPAQLVQPPQDEAVNTSQVQRSRPQTQRSTPGSERSSSQDPIPPKVNPDDRPADYRNVWSEWSLAHHL